MYSISTHHLRFCLSILSGILQLFFSHYIYELIRFKLGFQDNISTSNKCSLYFFCLRTWFLTAPVFGNHRAIFPFLEFLGHYRVIFPKIQFPFPNFFHVCGVASVFIFILTLSGSRKRQSFVVFFHILFEYKER